MTDSPQKPAGITDQFALLVDAVQDYAIFMLSPEGEIRSWNHGAARLFGYEAKDILGEHFSRFYPEEVRSEKPRYELATASSVGRVEDEGWRIRGDGKRFWANTIITALRNPRGELIGFAKVTRDLTEKRAAEEELRRSEETFRLIVESVFDYAIFMLDAKGNVVSWNEGARRIKGYEAHEIIGRHFSTFYSEEDIRAGKPRRELEAAARNGSVEDEGWRIRKDGTRFWANVVITAVYDDDGRLRGFAKVTRDITERKEAEEMRRSLLEQREARMQAEYERRHAEASYEAAKEANRAKDEFLMTLSHELRTPMTAILGWSRLLPTISPEDPMFAEAIASIGRSSKLQARLIDDVLDVSRIVAGKLRLTREAVELDRLLASAVDAVRPMADARGVRLALSLPSDLGVIIADPTRLHQVIWNLLTNGVKFTPGGGLVTVEAYRGDDFVEIAVRDTGEGIDPSFLPHVFEQFRQGEHPHTRIHGGLGLGLSIVRYLIQAHGGNVTAFSEGKGCGATFTIRLPVTATISPEAESSASTGRAMIEPGRLANLSMLVVDDDRETRDFLRAVLQRAGATVSVVESAHAALEELERKRPEVIVTDIAMPIMDGNEFAKNVRSHAAGAGTKIVALSAFPPGTTDRSSFDHYLTKPVDPASLIEAIENVARRVN